MPSRRDGLQSFSFARQSVHWQRGSLDEEFFSPSLTLITPAQNRIVRTSLFFAQLRQNAEILQRRRVAGHGFATGNFLEQTAHNFSAARFWQRFRKSHFIRLRDRAD